MENQRVKNSLTKTSEMNITLDGLSLSPTQTNADLIMAFDM